MNRLAALVLLVLDEERAFWVVDTMINELLPPLMFAESLQDAHAASYTLECLLGQGRLADALRAMGLPLSMVFTEWFMCLGTSLWPSEIVFRVWDAMFLDGFGVMFDVCLNMLRRAEDDFVALKRQPQALYKAVTELAQEWYDPNSVLGALGSRRSVAAAGVAFMPSARAAVEALLRDAGGDEP
jgi:hypothetical protein